MFKLLTPRKKSSAEIKEVFRNLPQRYKLLVTKSEIKFVLEASQTYHELVENPEANITAFLNEIQYIKGEASKQRSNISNEAIQAILNAHRIMA